MSHTIPILETERLFLLPWKLEYAEDMLLFAANKTVAEERGVGLIPNLKSAKTKISNYIENKTDDWAIALKTVSGNKIVGSIGIYKHAKSWKEFTKFKLSFNLVYLIAEEYWGMGICTEAAKKVMNYAFCGIKCDALGANHKIFNNRSRRVIEKCNFKLIGIFPKNKPNDPNAEAKYFITREDYFDLYGISGECSEYGFVDLLKYEQKKLAPRSGNSQPQTKQVKGSPYNLNYPIRRIDGISYIKEPTGYLCGQSCIAMLADVSVDEIINIIGTDRGTNKQDLKKALDYYGIRYAPKSVKHEPNVPLPNLSIIRMIVDNPDGSKYGHWGIFYKGVYYDPEFGVLNECPPNAKIFQVWEIYV